MALTDRRGVAVSTDNRKSLDRYERAVDLLHSYFYDPLAAIDEALAEDPAFVMGHCFRAGLLTTTTDKAVEPMLRKSVEAGEALAIKANDRERRHLAAARAWLEGDFEQAVTRYGDIAIEYPRDSLALQLAHLGDFYLGQSSQLRDRIARALCDWDESVPGYAHVLGMQGRLGDGVHWLTSRTDDWAPDNGFAFHNWWHLALYHLDLGQHDRVLELYDKAIRPKPSDLPLEMVD